MRIPLIEYVSLLETVIYCYYTSRVNAMVNCKARRLINRGHLCKFIFLFTRVEDNISFLFFFVFLNVRYRKYFILLRVANIFLFFVFLFFNYN